MTIDKRELDKSLRRVRRLYRDHVQGTLGPSGFATKARAELNGLYLQHTRSLVGATTNLIMAELRSFQTQFGLDLECHPDFYQVTRGYRGLRAKVFVRNKGTDYGSAEIYIGPFDEWDKIAVHTTKELEASGWNPPSFYTKRKRNRWQEIKNFDFPALLQRIKEDAEKPRSELEEEIAF